MSVEGFQYLHDLARHHLTLSGDCDIRLFRGGYLGSAPSTGHQLQLYAVPEYPIPVWLDLQQRGQSAIQWWWWRWDDHVLVKFGENESAASVDVLYDAGRFL